MVSTRTGIPYLIDARTGEFMQRMDATRAAMGFCARNIEAAGDFRERLVLRETEPNFVALHEAVLHRMVTPPPHGDRGLTLLLPGATPCEVPDGSRQPEAKLDAAVGPLMRSKRSELISLVDQCPTEEWKRLRNASRYPFNRSRQVYTLLAPHDIAGIF